MTTSDRSAAARAIDDFLRAIGRDPSGDPELRGTSARVADAYIDELCGGYDVDVAALLATSGIGTGEGGGGSEIVIVREIVTTTMCPHHLLPGQGHATVAYAPGAEGGLVGIGAIVRLVDAFAHRLTLQETIGEEVAAALVTHLKARWAGCRLVMSHSCMTARGERRHGARVESVALRAVEKPFSDAARDIAHRALGVGT